MMLLSSDVIDELGRIPRSSEGYAVDAVDALTEMSPERIEIFMVSHK